MKTIILTSTFIIASSCSTLSSILKESSKYISISIPKTQDTKMIKDPNPLGRTSDDYCFQLPHNLIYLDTFELESQTLIKESLLPSINNFNRITLLVNDTIRHFDPDRFVEHIKITVREIPVKIEQKKKPQ